MVTKAIERAQNTVEARNAEVRKDVLKYDEVMNEQRKVIYARRVQILEGEDLRARTIEVISSAIDSIVTANCGGRTTGGLDLDAMVTELRQYYPSTLTPSRSRPRRSDTIYESLPERRSPTTNSARRRCRGGAETRCARWSARSCSS